MQCITKPITKISRRQLLFNGVLAWAAYLTGFTRIPGAFASQEQCSETLQQPRIALIIDDIGYSRSIAMQFAKLNLDLTFSILPRLPYSRELGHELSAHGFEVMLHQPMEPYDACCDPGPGALFVGDSADKIERILDKNIGSMPFASGMNNHMGSRFTESPEEIRDTMRFIKGRGLFFIDSFTSSHSIAYATARRYRLSTAYRHVFLDNSRDLSAIAYQLYRLKMHAVKFGHAIGIGHPYRETALAIDRFFSRPKRSNIPVVGASKIISCG